MEWQDFQCSSLALDDSWYDKILSPQFELEKTAEWTFEENKLFENALAEFEPGSIAFFENVASKLPCKSMEEIKKHYQALVEDLEMIESGRVPIPDYQNHVDEQEQHTIEMRHDPDYQNHVDEQEKHTIEMKETYKKLEKGSSSSNEAKRTSNGHQRRRGVPWTEEEHQLFLMGLNKYGKGDWRSISRYYVITKTPTQVASHAQKYFRRQSSSTPVDRRRPSIHDIQTVSSIPTPPPAQRNIIEQSIPNFSSNYGLMIPRLNHNFINGVQNPLFLPMMNSTNFQPSAMNQDSATYLSSYQLLSSLKNQQCG